MALRQLLPGASLDAPIGPLRIRLDAPPGVRLELRDEQGRSVAPAHRASAVEAIVIPSGVPLVIGAVGAAGPFPAATLVGAAVMSASGTGDQLVRPRADVGGRTFVALLRYTPTPTPKLADALEAFQGEDRREAFIPRPWHRVGSYAYHAHHDDFSVARVGWSLVVDGSASMLRPSRRAGVARLLEALVGILGSAMGSAPASGLVCAYPEPRDVKASLMAEVPDWDAILGDRPSPWSRVGTGLERAAAGLDDQDLVVLVVDGPPVDLDQVEQWAIRTRRRLLVVVIGRSRFEHRLLSRPVQLWDDELGALEPLAAQPFVTVVSIADLDSLPDSAVELADALFPVPGGGGR